MARLREYRAKRDPARTPEPVPDWDVPEVPADHRGDDQEGRGDTFVVQEHHARALHWDVRLERDGVLVSWAVPKGLPPDPATTALAKQTEDHPLAYATFAGEIPQGEYGGGSVTVWDSGRYDLVRWTDDRVEVVLHGQRVTGRYLFLRDATGQWFVRRRDAAPPGWEPLPARLEPMIASAGDLPPDDGRWAYEIKWDGVRALARVEGGRLALLSRRGGDVTASYPELRELAEGLGSTQVLLDGEVVALGPDGRPDFGLLQRRMHVVRPTASLRETVPVSYVAFDVLHLDGRSLLRQPYDERRRVLAGLGSLGPRVVVPDAWTDDGAAVLAGARAQGLEGIVAKRRDSAYEPGRRSRCWVKVKVLRTQEVVVVGWKPGEGRRAGALGSLLLAVPDDDGTLRYAGHVGTGFSDAVLRDLGSRLAALAQPDPPVPAVPRAHARLAHWVEPRLVGEVTFTEWTREGRLRHPSWRGLRPDKVPEEVRRES